MRDLIHGVMGLPRNANLPHRPRADFILPLGMKIFTGAVDSFDNNITSVARSNSSGTCQYIPGPGVKRVLAMCIGGTGSLIFTGGGGTGGGGFAADLIPVIPFTAYPVVVGYGGTITAGSTSGGTSSFNGVLSATGSAQSTTTSATAGGSGSGGKINYSGGTGGAGNTTTNANNGGGGASGSPFGTGQVGGAASSSNSGGGGGLFSAASTSTCGTSAFHLGYPGNAVGALSEWYRIFGPYANLQWMRIESGLGGLASASVDMYGGQGAGFMGFGGGVSGGMGKHGAVIIVEYDQ